jgi:MFS family permease
MSAALRRSVASLSVPNYRRFFVGQIVSVSGNWMQNVAAIWLVLRLTDSGTAVGITAAAQFLPLLLFGAWGGLLADRVDKRRLLSITQTLLILPPLALFALVASGHIEAWMVIALVFAGGAVNAMDNPARQSFVSEIVGSDRVVNAVSLNSVIIHSSRIAGPAGAAAVIALAGVGPCFLLNALSYVAMIIALRRMDPRLLHPAPPARREGGQLRAAVRYVAATPGLRLPLLMMAVVGTLSFNFPTVLPLLARFTFHGNAFAFAGLTAALAVGSIAGALLMGSHGRIDGRFLPVAALLFGTTTLLAAAAPSFVLILLVLVPVGMASVSFSAGTNSAVQLAAAPEMRGRVMALYSIVFIGSTPIGAPIVGWLSSAVDPRAGLALGGAAALLTGVVALAAGRSRTPEPAVAVRPQTRPSCSTAARSSRSSATVRSIRSREKSGTSRPSTIS